jgi:lipoate-protein ligase A
MPCLIQNLLLLDERATPGAASWNMAVDEALLTGGEGAVLRVYRWQEPAFSFGYFLPWQTATDAAEPGLTLVRRWTGGGMVAHGDDFTWSLILPTPEPLARQRPVESYATIHGALARALREAGQRVEQVDASTPAPLAGLCFTAPAPGDLLLSGKKIAGAGQRRGRHGLLHQGSVCGVSLPEDFPQRLAETLAGDIRPFPPERVPVDAATTLVRERYGNEAWLRKR